jgi:membrane-associated phospholipid phosphatase
VAIDCRAGPEGEKLSSRWKHVGQDFTKLFSDWRNYYLLPREWKARQWIIFTEFILLVFIAARFDEPIRYFSLTIHGPLSDKIAAFVHPFGTGKPSLYIFLAIYITGLAINSEKIRLGGLMILQSFLYSGLITIALKSLVGRWRPNQWHGNLTFHPVVSGPNAYLSFPSGDVAVVFALAVVMAGLWKNKMWQLLWILLAVLTSLSRIYYNAHWFSDVVFSTVNASVAGVWVVRKYHSSVKGGETILD